MRITLLLLLLPSISAFQLSFKVPFFQSKLPVEVEKTKPRIAVVGAGAAGSSAAFWISKAKERFGLDVDVDVYEKESYIGGRSTTVYPYEDLTLPPIELGASIFVKANKNLWRAADEFNLTRRDFKDEDFELGIWDGENIRLTVASGWWDTIKVIWRYGFIAPKRSENIVAGMIKTYLNLYKPSSPKFDNLTELAATFGWTDMISQTTAEYFEAKGVSKKYIYELIEGATRVNYGQDADQIHALEGACSLAATGATSILGGNFQIFEKFLKHSNSTVYSNVTVHSITPKSSSSDHWTVQSDQGSKDYNAVILALPFHSSGISLPSSISSQIPEQPYVHLHVTLLTTTSPTIKAEYLNLPSSSAPPRMILTTNEGARSGGKGPEFNSLSYHGLIRDGEWSVKIFSKESISDEWLDNVFGNGTVGWVLRKEWDAYPELPPTTAFAPVRLDKGLFYVNGFERFISTMETQTIASRNVVDLLLNEEFRSSICPPKISASSPESPSFREAYFQHQEEEDFVLGWDC